MLENIGGLSYVPLIGDAYDIEHGTKKLLNGNLGVKDRILGAGQAAMGAAGLATLGVGSLGKSVAKGMIKGGGRYIAKYGAKKAMNKTAQEAAIRSGKNPLLVKTSAYFANKPYEKAVKLVDRNKGLQNFVDNYPFFGKRMIIPYVTTEGVRTSGKLLFGGTDDNSGTDVTNGNGTGGGTTSQGGQPGYYNGSGSSMTNGGITPEQLKQIVNMINTSSNTDGGSGYYDPRALYQNYMIKQQAMQPYRDELNNYIRDYKRYSDLSYNQDKHLSLLAALTGAQGLNQMIGKYTALGDEEKLAALKKVQGEDLKGISEGLDELIGNVALARKMGLPLDAVNANDKMLQLAVQNEMNEDRLENRLALAQYNATVKQKLQEERFRYQQAIKAGNRRVAQQSAMKISDYYKALQAMENYGATPEDIYRTTGRRIYVSNPPQSGQTFKNL
jgi:hypothetical protein